MSIMKLYDAMPVFMQNIAVSLEGWRIQKSRYGKLYMRVFDEFMMRNDLSYQEKCAYRDSQIRIMVKHCYETVPYYHRIFDELGIDYRDIRRLEDLTVLPILTKQTVKEHYDEFFSTKYDRKNLIKQHTSGTSGSGFIFYQNPEANAAVWAHVWRGNKNIGLERGTWCGYFGGRSIVPLAQSKPPHYRINYPGKQIMFSAFHMCPEVYQEYFDVLNKYKPKWIQAYPSSIVPLAKYMEDNDLRLSYVPTVLTLSSENVTQHDVDILNRVFGVYPMQNYAQSEAVATFRQKLDKRIFVDEDFAAVEFVPIGDGEFYRVVGTTLSNFAMPFLRYDTKDIVTYSETDEGREVLSIDGREEDAIKLNGGGFIRRLDFIFKDQCNVVEAQIIQKSLRLAVFNVVKGSGYTAKDEIQLRASIDTYLEGRIGYEIVYVDNIPKTASGKMKFIVSELK